VRSVRVPGGAASDISFPWQLHFPWALKPQAMTQVHQTPKCQMSKGLRIILKECDHIFRLHAVFAVNVPFPYFVFFSCPSLP
jgi:hypothetical protein